MTLSERIAALLLRKRHVNEQSGCWEYTGQRNQDGYGIVQISAHRLAAIIWLGVAPGDRRHACHRCDNQGCFNPEHLYMGSAGDNAKDRAARGRGREHRQEGPRNPNVKLTRAQVDEILRLLHDEGLSQTAVAKRFGIVQPHVSRLARGLAWAPRRKRDPQTYLRGQESTLAVLDEVRVAEILALAASGVRNRDLAAAYSVSPATITMITRRHRWTHVPEPSADQVAAARRAWNQRQE